MTEADAARRRLDMYLGEVRATLRGLDPAEVEEILAELRSHVLDRVGGEAGLTEKAVEGALGGLGAPRVLGAGYLGQRMAARVERNRSPIRILAAAFRLAGFSLGAFSLFFVSLTGYLMGVAFILVALLKPVLPDSVGMWVHNKPDGFFFSFGASDRPPGGDVVEVLGWWIIPISAVLGAVILMLTWRLSLAGIRWLGRRGPRLQPA
jgi:hypothetical protein